MKKYNLNIDEIYQVLLIIIGVILYYQIFPELINNAPLMTELIVILLDISHKLNK